MAEKSFNDRHARGLLLLDFCEGFSPAFAPVDTTLATGSFATFLNTIGTLNTTIDTQQGGYTTEADARAQLVKDIKTTVTRTLARLKSNPPWEPNWKSAKQTADKLRGQRPTKPKAPTEGEPPTATTTRNSGEQAYAEIAALFEKFISIVTAAPGYATAVPTAISPSSLNSQLSSLKGKNTGLSNLAADTITNQKKRLKLYYDPNGFQEKFQSIKDAVKSQYGQTSPEFIAVKGLKW